MASPRLGPTSVILPDPFTQISRDLKFIGTLREGQVVNVGSRTISYRSVWTSIYRFIKGETRDQTLDFVTRTVNDALMWIDANRQRPGADHMLEIIYQDLCECLRGIRNLKSTYVNDPMFDSTIRVLDQRIAAAIPSGTTIWNNPTTSSGDDSD